MQFDKWFNSQSTWLKVLLLVIPFVGWVMEILIRLSVMLRTKSVVHIVVFVLFLVVGWGWFLSLIDLVYMIVKGHPFWQNNENRPLLRVYLNQKPTYALFVGRFSFAYAKLRFAFWSLIVYGFHLYP